VAVGPPKDAYYGYYQEFGFYNEPGKGFMRASFDGGTEQALEIVKKEVWAAVGSVRSNPGGGGLL
jgi:hypothetical protein